MAMRCNLINCKIRKFCVSFDYVFTGTKSHENGFVVGYHLIFIVIIIRERSSI